jgi:anti-sigma B factor antagonist
VRTVFPNNSGAVGKAGEQGVVRAHEWDVSRRLSRAPGGRRPWWVAHPEPTPPEFHLEWESTGAHTVAAVSGDLDVLTAPQLEASVAEQPLAGCTVLEVDLGGVPSMGSVGLSVLLSVRRWCLQRGIELQVRGVQPSVWRVFEVTGLDGVFTAVAEPSGGGPTQDLSLF